MDNHKLGQVELRRSPNLPLARDVDSRNLIAGSADRLKDQSPDPVGLDTPWRVGWPGPDQLMLADLTIGETPPVQISSSTSYTESHRSHR